MLIDQLIRESLYYWPLENEERIQEVKTKLWGYSSNVTNKQGIQGRSLVNINKNGYMILGTSHTEFNKIKLPKLHAQISISFWLKYHSKNDEKGQTFFSTGSRGYKIFQHNGVPQQIQFKVSWDDGFCMNAISAPEGVWSHFVFMRSMTELYIYFNGEEILEYNSKVCEKGKNEPSNEQVVSGDPTTRELPNAELDEIIIWEKILNKAEVQGLYHYYKGFIINFF